MKWETRLKRNNRGEDIFPKLKVALDRRVVLGPLINLTIVIAWIWHRVSNYVNGNGPVSSLLSPMVKPLPHCCGGRQGMGPAVVTSEDAARVTCLPRGTNAALRPQVHHCLELQLVIVAVRVNTDQQLFGLPASFGRDAKGTRNLGQIPHQQEQQLLRAATGHGLLAQQTLVVVWK